jgi:hypothetical protein
MAIAALKEHMTAQSDHHATQMKALTDLVSTHLEHARGVQANDDKAKTDAKAAAAKPKTGV